MTLLLPIGLLSMCVLLRPTAARANPILGRIVFATNAHTDFVTTVNSCYPTTPGYPDICAGWTKKTAGKLASSPSTPADASGSAAITWEKGALSVSATGSGHPQLPSEVPSPVGTGDAYATVYDASTVTVPDGGYATLKLLDKVEDSATFGVGTPYGNLALAVSWGPYDPASGLVEITNRVYQSWQWSVVSGGWWKLSDARLQ